jgi:hypothetical protein
MEYAHKFREVIHFYGENVSHVCSAKDVNKKSNEAESGEDSIFRPN